MGKERPGHSGGTISGSGPGGSAYGTTPICRCRVMYLGSSVPHATKDGLQGIQEPLRELYPETGLVDYGSAGIDSWISVWSNGILIENVDDSGREVKRFFPIDSLHYCAAVRYVVIPSTTTTMISESSMANGPSSPPGSTLVPTGGDGHHHSHPVVHRSSSCEKVAKFLPLDSPFLRNSENNHPPLFACILRRTSGIKVLECHAFICKREPAANALVRCCFHAYADSMYAKQIEDNPYSQIGSQRRRRSRSISALDKMDSWTYSRTATGGDDDGGGDPDLINHHHHHPSDGSQQDSPGVVTNGHGESGHRSHHQRNGGGGGHNGEGTPSEIGATSTVSHSPDEDNNYHNNKPWPGQGHQQQQQQYFRPTSDSMMMTMINNAGANGTLMRSHGPLPPPPPLPPLPPNGRIPRYVIVPPPPPPSHSVPPLAGIPPPGHHPAFYSFPIIGDPEKVIKHSLKKKKKKSSSSSKSKSCMMIGQPIHPSQLISVPQCPPQLLHHHPPLPYHPHHPASHHPHIYGPPPPPPGSGQPLPPPPPPMSTSAVTHHHHPMSPSSTAYSVRGRLRRGPPLPPASAVVAGGPPDSYPIMYTSNEEPVYIPPMRPLTPLSNYHHPHHSDHYVQYPLQNYGTTPRRPYANGGDKINRKDGPGIGGGGGGGNGRGDMINNGHLNGMMMIRSNGPNGSPGSGDDNPDREASPASVGLYKRKGHLNERAFSYSIRQEHRSRSNSLANLQFDELGDGGGGMASGTNGLIIDRNGVPMPPPERRSSSSNNNSGTESHTSKSHGQSNGRIPSSSQINSLGNGLSDHHGMMNGHSDHHHHHRRDSLIMENSSSRQQMGLSQSMANLNISNGHPHSNMKDIPKTASIKRSSKQRNSLGSRGGLPIAPPVPPITPNMMMMNGKSSMPSPTGDRSKQQLIRKI